MCNETSPAPCTLCSLCSTRRSIVLPSPCRAGGLLAIGEAPGEREEHLEEGFVGQAGKTLDELLRRHGCSRGSDYGVANIVRCRPPLNRKPTKAEVCTCIPKLAETIAAIRPKVLLLVGGTAAEALLGKGNLGDKIERANRDPLCDFSSSHPAFQAAMREVAPDLYRQGIVAIPMPHTSGLAWNRTAKDGRRWSVIGAAQVARAVAHLEGRNLPKSARNEQDALSF